MTSADGSMTRPRPGEAQRVFAGSYHEALPDASHAANSGNSVTITAALSEAFLSFPTESIR